MAKYEHLICTKLTAKQIEINGPMYGDYLVAGTAVGVHPTTNPPSLEVFQDGLMLYQFEAQDQAFFTIHILHDIKVGSLPTLHIHWSHDQASPTGSVKWNVEYSIVKGYQAGVFPATRTVQTEQAAAAQYTHHITPDDIVLLAADDLEVDSVLIGRIYRDAADDFNDDPFLLQIDMHYEIGQMGTEERNRPFTSAGF